MSAKRGAWYHPNLEPVNSNVSIFVVWNACVCKCSIVTNAAGSPWLLDELCNETWLFSEVVQILKVAQKLQVVFLVPKMVHVMFSFGQIFKKEIVPLLITPGLIN